MAKKKDTPEVVDAAPEAPQAPEVRAGLVELPVEPALDVDAHADLVAENERLRAENAKLQALLDQRDAPATPPDQEDTSKPLWEVSLNAPTPVAKNPLRVRADDQHQAKLAFCAANGISDSSHAWKIERVS